MWLSKKLETKNIYLTSFFVEFFYSDFSSVKKRLPKLFLDYVL